MKYRKKPVVIEAEQHDGSKASACHIAEWSAGAVTYGRHPWDNYLWLLYVETAEGTMTASADDWIIRGVQGEYYPCKPDIFEATYEAAD